MSPTAYQSAAARTLPGNRPREQQLTMLALGIVGEWSEYERAFGTPESREEAGDVLWYLAGMATTLGVDLAVMVGTEAPRIPIVDALGYICESVKKHAFHGKDLDMGAVMAGCVNLYAVLRAQEPDLPGIMAANVAKLQARWPDGFRVQS